MEARLRWTKSWVTSSRLRMLHRLMKPYSQSSLPTQIITRLRFNSCILSWSIARSSNTLGTAIIFTKATWAKRIQLRICRTLQPNSQTISHSCNNNKINWYTALGIYLWASSLSPRLTSLKVFPRPLLIIKPRDQSTLISLTQYRQELKGREILFRQQIKLMQLSHL